MNDSGKQDVIKSGKRLVEAKQKFLENFKNLHGQLPPEKIKRAASILEDAFLICHLDGIKGAEEVRDLYQLKGGEVSRSGRYLTEEDILTSIFHDLQYNDECSNRESRHSVEK